MKSKIINELRTNSRQTLKDISKKTSIPITTLYNNIKKMESKELIKKHTTLVDFSKLGFGVAASIVLKVDKKERDSFKEFISAHECVNSAYEINSGYDFLVEVIHKNHVELKSFLERIEELFNIPEKKVYLMINTLRKEDFRP